MYLYYNYITDRYRFQVFDNVIIYNEFFKLDE